MVTHDLFAALVPALPLMGAILIASFKRKLGATVAGSIGTAMMAVAFVLSAVIFAGFDPAAGERIVHLFDWIDVGEMHIPLALRIDALSLTMMLIVTGIGTLIHLYSIGYMHTDERAATFFAQLNLFSFAMLLLVMGSNLLVTFIGWEGVGLCSYLLIGFWYRTPEYNYAARKAFVMNRIGDVAIILAMILFFYQFGSLDPIVIIDKASGFSIDHPLLITATLLLFFGATGKSAQIPLFTWLPDAMAGPTPVSALIHAATMVTAGIYLIARCSGLFEIVPFTQEIILWIGTATVLLAASIAIYQNDIKKVLAYSTVSQLGYMFVALGMGAYSAAMFHVTTHAFFKALLFLGAGSVIHALNGEQDIRRMGGLKGKIKITYFTFLIGVAAIAGLPLLSGFFSKDLILAFSFQRSPVLFALLLFGAAMTVFYMFRLLFMVFFGNARNNAHPHESPASMTIPLMVLAVLSVIGGALNVPHLFGGHEGMKTYLGTAVEGIGNERLLLSGSTEWILMIVTFILVAGTIALAYQRSRKEASIVTGVDPLPVNRNLIAQRWKVDELYALLFERPYAWLSGFFTLVECKLITPLMVGTGTVTIKLGQLVRQGQTGNASSHLFAMVAGMILFLLVTLLGIR